VVDRPVVEMPVVEMPVAEKDGRLTGAAWTSN
jgi:hypothetical protein